MGMISKIQFLPSWWKMDFWLLFIFMQRSHCEN